MKKLTLSLCAAVAMATAAYAGETYSKESKSVTPPPCPQWYADNEFNVTLSGAYVWTGNDWRDDPVIIDYRHVGHIGELDSEPADTGLREHSLSLPQSNQKRRAQHKDGTRDLKRLCHCLHNPPPSRRPRLRCCLFQPL